MRMSNRVPASATVCLRKPGQVGLGRVVILALSFCGASDRQCGTPPIGREAKSRCAWIRAGYLTPTDRPIGGSSGHACACRNAALERTPMGFLRRRRNKPGTVRAAENADAKYLK